MLTMLWLYLIRNESTREEESFSSWVLLVRMLPLEVQERSKMRRSLVK